MKNFVATMMMTCALARVGATGTSVEGYKDVARPLVVFAPSETDARFVQEVRELREQTGGLRERQVVVLAALEHEERGEWRHRLDARVWPKFGRGEQAAARSRFGVKPGSFAVVLVGKDGSEKLTQDGVLGFEQLRSAIDAMPMRRDEMKGRSARARKGGTAIHVPA